MLLPTGITGLLADLSSALEHVTNMFVLQLGGSRSQGSQVAGQMTVDPAKLSQTVQVAFRDIATGKEPIL